MKSSDLMLLASLMFIAPHMSESFALGAGAIFMLAAYCYLWRDR